MKRLLLIGVAGALGALARTFLTIWIPKYDGFPIATIAVNIVGAFVLCFLVEKTLRLKKDNETLYIAIMSGFLGAFTTFSTFSFEIIELLEHSLLMALIYMVISLVGGLVAGVLGLLLGAKGRER